MTFPAKLKAISNTVIFSHNPLAFLVSSLHVITLTVITLHDIYLQEADAGDYTCVATNDAGSSEGTATLTVRSKCLIKNLI